MIPQEQLQDLKPLPDFIKRQKLIRGKRHTPPHKLHLTKIQRSHACFPEVSAKGGYNPPDPIYRGKKE